MNTKILSEAVHKIPLIDPIADYLAGTKTTAPLNMREAHACTFNLYWGVGATGTSTVTIEACDDTTPTNVSALAFRYRIRTATDVWGALTAATTTGFTTTAGSSQWYQIHVDADSLAASGYKYLRLKAVEVVASARLGGCWAELWPLRIQRAVTATQLT